MHRNCDEDSGRSSCSTSSHGIVIHKDNYIHDDKGGKAATSSNKLSSACASQERHTINNDLHVSVRPRNPMGILKSPGDKDPFPCCSYPKNQDIFKLGEGLRFGGLTNAHSTLDIASSTRIEQLSLRKPNTALSLTSVNIDKDVEELKNTEPIQCIQSNFKRCRPVQRAASRLYRVDNTFKGPNKGCVGPEFIVRASQPIRHIDLTQSAIVDKKIVTVILLNGSRVEVLCDATTVTAGRIFEALVLSEQYEHNFMLGIAILIGGDFVFLPDDYKIKKIAPDSWSNKHSNKGSNKNKDPDERSTVTVFLRIKFFLPTNIARNVRGGEWRYRVYLQLRRATIEGLLISNIQNLVLLAGYALHIEFGEFSYREHGSSDYFLLEHYLPESLITNEMSDVKLRMKRAHESRRGLDKNKAIINYIILAQTFPDYGCHFYSAVWVTRDGFCHDVWLSIGPRGIALYSHNNCISVLPQTSYTTNYSNRIVLQSLPWHHIRSFHYSKKSLYIIPNLNSGLSKMGVKYKLKMTDNKSYFSFWLASLHHKLYLKLYAKEDFIYYLSDELSFPFDDDYSTQSKADCSNYQDSYNLAVRNPIRMRRPPKRRFRVDLFGQKKIDMSDYQNKENQKPSTEKLLRNILTDDSALNQSMHSNSGANSSNDCLSSPESCSLPRRQGVKMGTRVFNGNKSLSPTCLKPLSKHTSTSCRHSDADATTQSDSDDLTSNSEHKARSYNINSMKLLPQRQYNQNRTEEPTAYVIGSPKVYQDLYAYNQINESYLNNSLFDRLDSMDCVQGERVFVTAVLHRDMKNALGLQVAEGSDGNVYIKSVTTGGPAELTRKLLPGDQIISVNGQNLLNIKYDKALALLQSAPQRVELIVLQNSNKCTNQINKLNKDTSNSAELNSLDSSSILDLGTNDKTKAGSELDNIQITDNDLFNEEALKAIYALIKLTKDKVITRMRENSDLSTPNKVLMQQCLSDNKSYDESDVGISSNDCSPSKTEEKFNSWRIQTSSQPKRRPLSLNIPPDVDLTQSNKQIEIFLQGHTSGKKLSYFDSSKKAQSNQNIALPRNFSCSRKWLGPVRYPVTPCKNNTKICNSDNIQRNIVYGASVADEEQIFL